MESKSVSLSCLGLGLITLCVLPGYTNANTGPAATFVQAKLPWNMDGMEALYDGGDLIYLFGGRKETWRGTKDVDTILRYNISMDSVELIGHLQERGSHQIPHQHSNGTIFVFYKQKVDKFDPFSVGSNSSRLKNLYYNYDSHYTVKQGNTDNLIMLGGSDYDTPNKILHFDMDTLKIKVVGKLPIILEDGTIATCNGDTIYAFETAKRDARFLRMNAYTFNYTIGNHSFVEIFPGLNNPKAITDVNQNIYLVGGGLPQGGIFQWIPDSANWTFVPVEKYPIVGRNKSLEAPGMAYVPKLNRIYMFGGLMHNNIGPFPTSDIWFVDLTPTQSTEYGDSSIGDVKKIDMQVTPPAPNKSATTLQNVKGNPNSATRNYFISAVFTIFQQIVMFLFN